MQHHEIMRIVRDPTDRLHQAMSIISQCHGRIDQDSQNRRPEGPIAWRGWQIDAARDILRLYDASIPASPTHRDDTIKIVRDQAHPLHQSMIILSNCHGRIDQDAQNRHPEGPVTWRGWQIDAAKDILALHQIQP